jgi:hypothetical protein
VHVPLLFSTGTHDFPGVFIDAAAGDIGRDRFRLRLGLGLSTDRKLEALVAGRDDASPRSIVGDVAAANRSRNRATIQGPSGTRDHARHFVDAAL